MAGKSSPVSRTILVVAGVALTVGLVSVLFLYDPRQHAFYPRCFLHELTGWRCAGCGSLRALHSLLHGDLLTALQFNALLVLGLGLGLLWLGFVAWRKNFRASVAEFHFNPLRVTWLLLAVALGFSLLRNLPGALPAWLTL